MAKALLLILMLIFVHSFAQTKVLELHRFQWDHHVSRCQSPKSRGREIGGAIVLEMKHNWDCSLGVTNWNKKMQNRLVKDELRVQAFQSRIKSMISEISNSKIKSSNSIPLTSGMDLDTLNYIVSLNLGGRNLSMIVDTGSDLTWVQCQPCKTCYNQKDPLFNPSTSLSYNTVPCNTSICERAEGQCDNINTTKTCGYVVNYGDGSYTRGEIGRDRLNLGSSKVVVDDFVFGCGRDNKGLFGEASGLLGLGRDFPSLVSQTASLYGGVFSYCLPSTEPTTSGSLILGRMKKNSSAHVSYTRLIPNPQLSTFYFLNMTGISVGGVAIESPSFGNSMMTIDSGTVITRLPPTMYKALKAEFRKQFSDYPTASTYLILDTCFNLTGYQKVDVPVIKLKFEGNVEMNVDVSGILYFVKNDGSQVCLALSSCSSEDETGIIGNYQQKNQRVIYKTNKSKLGFVPENCSFK